MTGYDPQLGGWLRWGSATGSGSTRWATGSASELCGRLETLFPAELMLPAGAFCKWVLKDHLPRARVEDACQVLVVLSEDGWVVGRFGSWSRARLRQPSVVMVSWKHAGSTHHEFVDLGHERRAYRIAEAAGPWIAESDVLRGLGLANVEEPFADVVKVLFRPLNPETGGREWIDLLVDHRNRGSVHRMAARRGPRRVEVPTVVPTLKRPTGRGIRAQVLNRLEQTGREMHYRTLAEELGAHPQTVCNEAAVLAKYGWANRPRPGWYEAL